ncbi:glycosyltransferase [uncultured Parolsenella sp.]|uniref:glycosyltransferase n=1 Tax=uncultured Parolsenella sp. TaxID=2083008 RepID=UPI0027D9968D|nr:glycosyltransferase [uncultured Parolsenella sp.]
MKIISSLKNRSKVICVPDNIIFILLLIPFVEPQMFKTEQFAAGDKLYAGLKLISAAVIITLYIVKRRKCSLLTGLVMVLQAWILISTVVENGSLSRYSGPAISMVAMVMLGELVIDEDILSSFLRQIRTVLSVFIVVNIISIILIKLQVISWEYPFLGIDNRWSYFLLPWVMVAFLYDEITLGQTGIRSWSIYMIATLHVLVTWSVGALLSLIMWPVFWQVVSRRGRAGKETHLIYASAVFLLINVLLIGGILLPMAEPLVVNYLHKDITLSGRTLLWKAALGAININPLFGHGVQPSSVDQSFFFELGNHLNYLAVNHPHNYLLNVMFHGGYIAGLLFIIIYAYVSSHIIVNNRGGHVVNRTLYCSFSIFYICSLVDTMDFSLFHLMLPLALGITSRTDSTSVETGREETCAGHAVSKSNSSSTRHLFEKPFDLPAPTNPFFSIVIPVYNCNHSYLIGALDSIMEQSLRDFEIIIVNDGSDEATSSLCREIAREAAPCVTLIEQENRGTYGARISGAYRARGFYTIFLDADDRLRADALEKIKGTVDSSDSDLIIYRSSEHADFRRDSCTSFYWFDQGSDCSLNDVRRLLLVSEHMNHIYTYAIKTTISSRIPLLDKHLIYGEDKLHCALVVNEVASLYALDEVLYYYRINNNGITKGGYSISKVDNLLYVHEVLRPFLIKWHMLQSKDEFDSLLLSQLSNEIALCSTHRRNLRDLRSFLDRSSSYADSLHDSAIRQLKIHRRLIIILMTEKRYNLLTIYCVLFRFSEYLISLLRRNSFK